MDGPPRKAMGSAVTGPTVQRVGGVVHVLGSLNLDHPVRVARHPVVGETVEGQVLPTTPGGKGLNQAVAAALAGATDGVIVHLHGTVGADDAGRTLLDFAAARGVRVEGVRQDPDRPTGTAWITVADGGANTVIVDPGANAATAFDEAAMAWSSGDIAVAQLEVPVGAVEAMFRSATGVGVTTLFNPSPMGPGRALLALASVVVVNQHELGELAGVAPTDAPDGEASAHLAGVVRQTEQTIVVTLGAAGAIVVDEAGHELVGGEPVQTVDTTGAGDCFLGVLAASLASGRAMPDAMMRANRAAALSTTRTGAARAMPTAFEIDGR